MAPPGQRRSKRGWRGRGREVYAREVLRWDRMKRTIGPSPEKGVERFLAVKGTERRELMDGKFVLDQAYKSPKP